MSSSLAIAEAALERGEYSYCLSLLKPLAKENALSTQEGPKIRMLMATAFMGQGNEQKAISICRLLTRCNNQEFRQWSSQLLIVLDAPSLQRPSNWSVELPNLNFNEIKKTKPTQGTWKAKKAISLQLPPTGPTKGLDAGFLSLVLIVFLGLTILLSN